MRKGTSKETQQTPTPRHSTRVANKSKPLSRLQLDEPKVILDYSKVPNPHLVETSNVDATPQRTFMTGCSPSTSSTSRDTFRIDVTPLGCTSLAPTPPAPPIIITEIEHPLSELDFSFLNDFPVSSASSLGQPSPASVKAAKESKVKDPLALPIGRITRACATKLLAALNAFVEEQVILELQDHNYARCGIELEEALKFIMVLEACKEEAAH
ncbi:hypothetical protein JCGZ_17488 [Jatropha curcas]|uniref:Uncharacterized protein n=1 Tax=Jatropha curcas TaxID=180498 RepID=A0A067K299_JATCU|nr:hypothetical protein JCGZ_17488 [Jatropha curcas]